MKKMNIYRRDCEEYKGPMETNAQCIACIERAAERTFSLLEVQPEIRQESIKEIKHYLKSVDTSLTPMEVSFGINEIMRKYTGIYDPFKFIKDESNKNALKLVNDGIKIIEESKDPLYDAIRISIAGNIIDYGMKSGYNLSKTLDEVMGKEPFLNDYHLLKDKISTANNICFLADNAGEIVFDKLLIDQINKIFKGEKISLVVKKYPFMNDVILEDLTGLGFEKIPNVEIITVENLTTMNYSNIIKKQIESADVVIAKGQGNFELLYDKKWGIFFLFLVKCESVRSIFNSELEAVIISYH